MSELFLHMWSLLRKNEVFKCTGDIPCDDRQRCWNICIDTILPRVDTIFNLLT